MDLLLWSKPVKVKLAYADGDQDKKIEGYQITVYFHNKTTLSNLFEIETRGFR